MLADQLVRPRQAAEHLRVSIRTIERWVDAGLVIWAWDIRTRRRGRPVWRIWSRDCATPRLAAMVGLDEVLQRLLGTRRRLRCDEVCDLLTCSHTHVYRLIGEGQLRRDGANGTLWIETASLDQFLRRRWAGSRNE